MFFETDLTIDIASADYFDFLACNKSLKTKAATRIVELRLSSGALLRGYFWFHIYKLLVRCIAHL